MLFEILGGLAVLMVLLYLYFQWKFTYWTKKGVYQIKPTFPFGTVSAFFTKKENFLDFLMREAKETENLPYYGGYFLVGPILVVKDADMVRTVLVKDFEHFANRTAESFTTGLKDLNKNAQIWSRQMTNASGEEWKNLRATFSPIFTSGRMKAMMIFMQESCKQLLAGIDEYEKKKEPWEIKEMLGKYSMDTIASCAFGVNAESFTNKNSKFVEYAQSIFRQNISDAFKIILVLLPGGYHIAKTFNIEITKPIETEFFYKAVLSSLNHRRESKVRRNDLVDLMLDAIQGEIKHEVDENADNQFEKDAKLDYHAKKTFDELVIVSTALVFLVAGYDTTGTTLAWAVHEIAKNQEIQDKLRSEIEDVTNGDSKKELTYDDLNSMTYLDQVWNETLRFHTPAAALTRACTKEYTVPNTDITMTKDQVLWVNIVGIHFDRKHYEDPYSFNPEHFSKEAKSKRHP